MAKKLILVLGSAHMELTLTAQRLPNEGESLQSNGKYGFSGGGSGFLAAIAAARMGADSMLCARVGNDVYGNRLRNLLETNGVNPRCVQVDKSKSTSLKVNLAAADREASSLLYGGAAPYLSSEDIEEAFVSYPDALALCGDLPFPLMREAAGFALEDGVPVFLKVPPASPDLPLHDLGRLTAAVLGEKEILSYTGMRPDSVSEYVHAAIKLSGCINSDYFVFHLGKRGAYVTDGKYSEMIAPVPVDTADLTASSESFLAALAARYVLDRDMKHSASYACAAAALSAARLGGVGSIPQLSAVQELLERMEEL